MSRTFARRVRDRIERLERRAMYLQSRIVGLESVGKDPRFDKQERSAILWALEEIDRLDAIVEALEDRSLSDGERLAVITVVCDSRWKPTEADLERTPGMASYYERLRELHESAVAVDPHAASTGTLSTRDKDDQ